MDCKECDSQLHPIDTDENECKCGGLYCGNCDAEYNKKGEPTAGGLIK